jgi:hypothetical protein
MRVFLIVMHPEFDHFQQPILHGELLASFFPVFVFVWVVMRHAVSSPF